MQLLITHNLKKKIVEEYLTNTVGLWQPPIYGDSHIHDQIRWDFTGPLYGRAGGTALGESTTSLYHLPIWTKHQIIPRNRK